MRRHAGEPACLLFVLNGMKGTAPTASIAVRLSFDRYALSADISDTVKVCAVVARSAGS